MSITQHKTLQSTQFNLLSPQILHGHQSSRKCLHGDQLHLVSMLQRQSGVVQNVSGFTCTSGLQTQEIGSQYDVGTSVESQALGCMPE